MKYFIIPALCISLSLSAQNFSTIEDVEILQNQEEVITKLHPNVHSEIQINDVERITPKHSVISFSSSEGNHEVVVNSSRKDLMVVARYNQIPKSEMPRIVVDQVADDSYNDIKLVAFYEVQEPTSEMYYAIKVSDGDSSMKLHFDEWGHHKKRPY